MNKYSNDSQKSAPDGVHDKAPDLDFDFDLPVEPGGCREHPPKGTWDAGYRLSLKALQLVKNRPEIFDERDRTMCRVEFAL